MGARAEPGRGGRRGEPARRPRRRPGIALDPEDGAGRRRARRSDMRGARAARGSVLTTPEGARAVVRSGVPPSSGCPASTRPCCCCGWRRKQRQRSRGGEMTDDRARPRRDALSRTSGPRQSATPMVEAYHTAIRKLVAERFAASGKTWEEAVQDRALRAHARGLREGRGRPARRRATGSRCRRWSRCRRSPRSTSRSRARRHRRARDATRRAGRSSAPATTCSRRAADVDGHRALRLRRRDASWRC